MGQKVSFPHFLFLRKREMYFLKALYDGTDSPTCGEKIAHFSQSRKTDKLRYCNFEQYRLNWLLGGAGKEEELAIAESQLTTWSGQGSIAQSKATHEAIRNAISRATSPLSGKEVEAYLQGSYKNDTNIRGDSDVDLVVQLNTTFQHDLTALSETQKRLFEQTYPGATYQWADLRRDVLASLRDYFGTRAVTEGNKSIKIAGESGRLPSDVVVCLLYKRYKYFYASNNENYVSGIAFYAMRDRRLIINYPKPHYDNGVTKNDDRHSCGWYKPTVRIFKNARNHLIDRKIIPDNLAPSYFLECMMYNVPDSCFGGTYQRTFREVISWLNGASLSAFICQNGQLPLFGSTPEQWDTASAQRMVGALIDLWNNG